MGRERSVERLSRDVLNPDPIQESYVLNSAPEVSTLFRLKRL
jgi:hypothetical protein